jgi:hypothetical protein
MMSPFNRLENLALSEILVEHMLGELSPQDIKTAKEIFPKRIQTGESILRQTFHGLTPLLNLTFPQIVSFSEDLSYLGFLYGDRPKKIIDRNFASLSKEDQDRIEIYRDIFDRQNHVKDGFSDSLAKNKNCIEAAYSDMSRRGRDTALVILRRKDSDRAIDKVAERLVTEMWKIDTGQTLNADKDPRKVKDWFGLKAATYHSTQVRRIVELIYQHLPHLNLVPNPHRERALDKEGKPIVKEERYVLQRPGIDDHYQYGKGADQLVQIKAEHISTGLQLELVVTDVANMLANEMEHSRYRARQQNELKTMWGRGKKQREYYRMYQLFKERAQDLVELMSEQRALILDPSKCYS